MLLKTAELKQVLKYAKTCLPSTSVLPMLSHIPILTHICFKDNKVFVFNGIESIVIDYETGLNCAIPGKLFCDFIEAIMVESLEIIQEETKVKIKVGRSIAKFEMIPTNKFIYSLPETLSEKQIDMDSDFINGMKKCLISINADNTKINQYGITLNDNCLYSTDSKRISKYKLQKELKIDFKILIPRGFCEIFTKIINDTPCIMSFSDKYISAEFKITLGEETTDSVTPVKLKNIKLYTEVFADIAFLDYTQFNNMYIEDSDFYLNTDFRDTINKCNLFLSGLSEKVIEFNVTDTIEINAIGKLGNYNDNLDIKVIKNIGKFNAEIELLKQLINNTTFIKFIKDDNRVIILWKEGNYLHLLGSMYTHS